MKVRAKFKVDSISTEAFQYGKQSTVSLSAVTSDGKSDEDRSFWEATPSGSITIQIANATALQFFEPGKEVFVDFEQA